MSTLRRGIIASTALYTPPAGIVPFINPGQFPGGINLAPQTLLSDTEFNTAYSGRNAPPGWIVGWYNNPGVDNDGVIQNGTPMYGANTVFTTGGMQQYVAASGSGPGPNQTGGLICSGSYPTNPIAFLPRLGHPIFVEFYAYLSCQAGADLTDGTVLNWPEWWIVTTPEWVRELDLLEGLGSDGTNGSPAAHWHFSDNASVGALNGGSGAYAAIPNAYNRIGLYYDDFETGTTVYMFCNGDYIGSMSPPGSNDLSFPGLSQPEAAAVPMMMVLGNSITTVGNGVAANNPVQYARLWQDA